MGHSVGRWESETLVESSIIATYGIRERERNLDLVGALDDLKGIGHIHRSRHTRQIALELGVAVNPMLLVLLASFIAAVSGLWST